MTTKAEQHRMKRLHDIGCIACWKLGIMDVPPEIHHIVGGSYRRHSGGHMATLPLCPWHHRGSPFETYASATEKRLGPSLATNKKAFVKRFGTERQLLAQVNSLIYQIEAMA